MRFLLSPHIPVLAVVSSVMIGCASAPEPTPEPVIAAPPPAALNLPEPGIEACPCEEAEALVENYFDRGVRSLAARYYEQAKTYFERHREDGSSEAQREADVGIAFVTLMSDQVRDVPEDGAVGVDERAEVMILALAAVQTLEGRIESLDALVAALSKDLKKREEALKRLRDLTLGQQEVSP